VHIPQLVKIHQNQTTKERHMQEEYINRFIGIPGHILKRICFLDVNEHETGREYLYMSLKNKKIAHTLGFVEWL
jgi:hypothetical protein